MDWVSVGATALQTHSQIQAGKAAAHQAELLARQREKDALAAQVEAQQVAAQERKKSRYLRSRALAVAGASGAGVSDSTITNILTGIDTEGEMNALNALWSGDQTAQAYRAGARMARAEGKAAKRAGYLGGAVTALRGGMEFAEDNPTFFKKYGGDKAASIAEGEWDVLDDTLYGNEELGRFGRRHRLMGGY
jgi:hypothetical protein